MTPNQRRAHRAIWLLLPPLLAAGLASALASRPPAMTQEPPSIVSLDEANAAPDSAQTPPEERP